MKPHPRGGVSNTDRNMEQFPCRARRHGFLSDITRFNKETGLQCHVTTPLTPPPARPDTVGAAQTQGLMVDGGAAAPDVDLTPPGSDQPVSLTPLRQTSRPRGKEDIWP